VSDEPIVLIDGATWIDANGYRRFGQDKYEHIAVAERALGCPLPPGAVVHHVDGDRTNNSPSNLVICPTQAYHMLLHARQRVVDAGGNPNTQKVCKSCRQLLEKTAFSFENSWDDRAAACRECTNSRRRGKKYGKWNERAAVQQRARRAARKVLCQNP